VLIANIVKKMTKIVIFDHFGNSTPLYEENLIIIDSKTAMPANIKMKVSEVHLFREKVLLNILSLTSLKRENIVNCIASR
jgi:hypothetical protein